MHIRPFKLPQDVDLMNSLVIEGFQYPENPAWSVQSDEVEGMNDRVRGLKRMWPILRIMRVIFPAFRDALCGFIAEEDGHPVGLINFMRHGREPEWHIANVAVLPAYRRRGIARTLVEATLQELRNRNAMVAILEVVAGNIPAIKLYEEMGFEAYTTTSEYDYEKDGIIPDDPIPQGVRVEQLQRSDWRTGFEFAKRVTPGQIAKYEPVLEKRYRRPLFQLLLGRLFDTMGNSRSYRFSVRGPKDEVVGLFHVNYRIRPGGVNFAEAQIDPSLPELARPVLSRALAMIQKASPSHRIRMYFEDWQPDLIRAGESLGCERRFGVLRMGLFFTKS
jgi:ribosomal protein S18 acetylase RimI-like enzyme